MVLKIALTPAFSLLPLLVKAHFGGNAAQLGLLESVAGVGILSGGLILSVWGGFRRRIYTSLMGGAILGLGFILLGSTPGDRFWLALGSVFVVGSMIPLVDGPIMAILQGTVEPAMQGRVMTIMGSLLGLTAPLGLVFAGPVSDWLGLQVWYLVAGTLCIILGLGGRFVPAIANIEENHRTTTAIGESLSRPATEVSTAAD
jgi:DHA3 family macrolide efflux protein-like MFS transporter